MKPLSRTGIATLLALTLAVAACSSKDPSTSSEDAGSDAGLAADAGTRPTLDSGRVEDAGISMDSGAATDSGTSFDAGASVDAGSAADAGNTADAGAAGDAGDCISLPTSGSITLAGWLKTTSPTWHRPEDDVCPSALDDTENYYVETFVFCNHGDNADFRFFMWGDENPPLTLSDPYLTIYAGVGIPTNATLCLATNDDAPGDRGFDSMIDIGIDNGETVTVAASQYEEVGGGVEAGTYELEVTRL